MGKNAIAEDVAARDPYAPSRRMQSAAVAERTRIERELARLDARREALVHELSTVEAGRAELHDQLRVLNRFVHDLPEESSSKGQAPLRVVPDHANGSGTGETLLLRGARIREAAVRVLAGMPEAEGPVHYRTWFELFTRHGFMPAGKDPLATFLTQIGRSPAVTRTSAPGTYQLDFDFPTRARKRVADLRTELNRTHEFPVNASVDDIAAARRHRAELSAELEATEKHLEEALRSLGGTE